MPYDLPGRADHTGRALLTGPAVTISNWNGSARFRPAVVVAPRDVQVTNEKDLHSVRASYGLIGVIYEVTFAVQPRTKVKYQYTSVDLGRYLDRGDALPALDGPRILGKADGFLGFLLPYRRQLL